MQAPAFDMCLAWSDGQSSGVPGKETALSGLKGGLFGACNRSEISGWH